MVEKFNWDKDIPGPVLEFIKGHFAPFAWLVPGWVQKVSVLWEPNEDSAKLMTCAVFHNYRELVIRVFPLFLADECPGETVVHELIHGFNNYAFDQALNLINAFKDRAPEHTQLMVDHFITLREQVTQDLAHVIYREWTRDDQNIGN